MVETTTMMAMMTRRIMIRRMMATNLVGGDGTPPSCR
jgi:hypothetical protein